MESLSFDAEHDAGLLRQVETLSRTRFRQDATGVVGAVREGGGEGGVEDGQKVERD